MDEPVVVAAIRGEHHVARYCGGSLIDDGVVDGTAFALNPDEDCLSVDWLEFWDTGSKEDDFDQVRAHNELTPGASAKFALLGVAATHDYVLAETEGDTELRFEHAPTDKNPGHSEICGYEHEDDLVGDLIAESILDLYPARTG